MIKNIINLVKSGDDTEDLKSSESKSEKISTKNKIINIFIEDEKNSDSSNDFSLKESIIDIFIEEESTDFNQNEDVNNQSDSEEENNIVKTNNTTSGDYIPSDYKNLSDREKHILKLDKLNKDVGTGVCPTCKEKNIETTDIKIEDKEKTVKVHSCKNAGCHRYIYPGDRDSVGILRNELEENDILKKTLK